MPFTRPHTRAQVFLTYLVFTGAIATGLALFTSASTIIGLIRSSTEGLFLPLLLALIVTFLLEPPVRLIERYGLNRTSSIFLVFLLVSLAMFLTADWFIPHWQKTWVSLQADIPRYLGRFVGYLKDLQSNLQTKFPFLETYDIPGRAKTFGEQLISDTLPQIHRSALRIGSLFILVPLFSFFFLRDGRRIIRSAISLVPNRHFEMAHDLAFLVTRQLAHFIRGRILEATIVGLVVGVGLSLTDIRYVPFLAVFAGVTNLIPYIGPLVGMIPGILIALVDLGMGGQFWWIVTVYFLIAQVIVDSFILIPILISRVSDLHPLWVILAIIMGGKLYGVVGMIIGVPIACIIKITILEIRQYRQTFALPEPGLEPERPH